MSLQDLSDPGAVIDAMREFDRLGRQSFLDKYGFGPSRQHVLVANGREYDSKPIVAAAHGIQHPDHGPLANSDFSGGEQTTNKLQQLGFQVAARGDTDELGNVLHRFLDAYGLARSGPFHGDQEAAVLLKLAAQTISAALPDGLSSARVTPSVGRGNWAASPWIAVLDQRVTTTTQEGVYPVVLIREDLEGLYVTLAQGVTHLKRELGQSAAYEVLSDRADDLQPALSDLLRIGFTRASNVFLGNGALARDYANSVVVSKHYSRDDLPSSEIAADVAALNEAYASLIERGLVGTLPSAEAVHEPQVLVVYVGHRALANFEAGGRRGWWGWKRAFGDDSAVRVGDLIAFTSGFSGGNVRVDSNEWRRGRIGRLVVGRVDKPPFRTDEPVMPDELSGEIRYPWKVRFTILGEEHDLALDGAQDLSIRVAEAIRLSAISQGRGALAPVAGSRALEQYGVSMDRRLPGTTSPADLRAFSEVFLTEVHASGMRLDADQTTAFLASALTKRFVILTGQSGSGKTQLAMRIGEWCGEDPAGRARYLVVPVRPDWTGPEFLFGYPDGLAERIEGRVVWAVPETLEFLLRAHQDPAAPYVLVLDEMNLAHVERYFADFLSGIESREPILPNLSLHQGRWTESSAGGRIPLPSNVVVVGTVNVDETTYMFSPKVLDRAFVHEFRVSSDQLDAGIRRPTPIAPAGSDVHRHVVRILQDDDWHFDHPHDDQERLVQELRRLHEQLAKLNLEFGHRVLLEAMRFAAIASAAGLGRTDTVLDYIVLTKLLPKIHGSRQRLEVPLGVLRVIAAGEKPEADGEPRLPRTAAKLSRMQQTLRDTQFVSFTD